MCGEYGYVLWRKKHAFEDVGVTQAESNTLVQAPFWMTVSWVSLHAATCLYGLPVIQFNT